MEWVRPPATARGADTLYSAVDYHRLLPKWPPSPVLRGNMRSMVLDSLHYIRNGDGSEELFHLGKDSRETRQPAGRTRSMRRSWSGTGRRSTDRRPTGEQADTAVTATGDRSGDDPPR